MKDKVALVTGASSGIGMEIALALAGEGCQTFACTRGDHASALKEEAAARDVPVTVITRMDVNSAEAVAEAVATASAKGSLDIVVNNAGYGQFGCAEDVSISEFREQFETNFFSVVQMIQAVAPIMRRQGSGDIINISSVAGRMGLPGSPAYISSKFALEGLTECLRYELGQFGIRATLIEPGVVKTKFFDSMRIPESHADPKYKEITEHMLEGIKMMVQMGTPPAKVAAAVITAVKSDDMLPRYVVGSDAEMFMKARAAKTDAEFEQYMGEELFPK